ncbi:ankyrin repeat domain-containing protein [Pseudovibrio sp. FO-BEG1]|uniref:ankyrin repeat domain-containing protein n=1 Tax=Pseudovibrio sp. (strain FO-BEG1) TaxID=911045 RepID=UPI0005A062E7|nr:ankyrin repeat domain-containing protein [Pseudovibrio sp. FO-BEG1]
MQKSIPILLLALLIIFPDNRAYGEQSNVKAPTTSIKIAQVSTTSKTITRITPNGCVASFWALPAFSEKGLARNAEKHISGKIKPSQINTNLMSAVVRNQGGVVKKLLAAGVDINEANEAGCTALLWAISFGNVYIFELLVANQADVHQEDAVGTSPLMVAAVKGSGVMAQKLIDAGANAKLRQWGGINERDRTALHYASYRRRNTEVLALLVKAGADIDAKEERGYTPLMAAARAGNIENVRFLVENGADALLANNAGLTAWHIAKTRNKKDILKYLSSVSEEKIIQ